MVYVDQLSEDIDNDVHLYYVWALNKPTEIGGHWKKIGVIKLDGELIKSGWADENLFFRHGYMDFDLKEHPHWAKYTQKYKCPLGF